MGSAEARGLVVAALLLALATSAPGQRLLPTGSGVDDDAPIVIHPRGPQYGFRDEEDASRFVWVFLNGVDVVQGERTLSGDSLVLVLARGGDGDEGEDEDSGGEPPDTPAAAGTLGIAGGSLLEVYLDGNVSMSVGNRRVLSAESYFEDRAAGFARLRHGEIVIEEVHERARAPLIVRYEKMRVLPDGDIEAEDVVYTNCEFAEPHWHVRTPWLRIQDTPAGRIMTTGSNTMRLGSVSALWWPGYDLNLDDDRRMLLRSADFGSSSRFGAELQTLWGADASTFATRVMEPFGVGPVRADWEGVLAYYGERGLFTEFRFEYETASSKGRLLTSYIEDDAELDSLDRPIESDDRGRIDLEHRTVIDEDRVLDVELSYQSEAGYLREYYEGEFRQDKPQESFINYRDVDENEALNLLARFRLNDFDTQVEYLPQIERRLVGEKLDFELFGQDVFATSRTFLSNARLRFDDRIDGAQDQDTLRVGNRTRFDVPLDVGDDRLDLFTMLDVTGFDHSVDEGGLVRHALASGAAWERTYWSTSDTQDETWNIDGLRHIVEPRVEFMAVHHLSHGSDELYAIDEVESLDRRRVVTVGLRDRWQTHQDGQVKTILNTDLALEMFPNEERDGPDQHTLGNLRIDTTWQPGANITGLRDFRLDWRAEYDPTNGTFAESNTRATSRIDADREIQFRHNRVMDDFEFATIATTWRLTTEWTSAVFTQYDLDLHEHARSGLLLRQAAHRWYIDYVIEYRRGNDFMNSDSTDEIGFTIRFRPVLLTDTRESLLDQLNIPRRLERN